jgi:hypothetical protein
MTAPANATWPQVMAGVTGLRLAIYDELLWLGALSAERVARAVGKATLQDLQEAAGWLETHGLLVSNDGIWRAVPPHLAAERWAERRAGKGTEGTAATEGTKGAGAGAAVRAEPVGALQRHQAQFLDLEGYRK